MPFDKYLLMEYLQYRMDHTDLPEKTVYAEIIGYCRNMEIRDRYFELQRMYNNGWRP